MNPLAVVMAVLVLITAPWLLTTFRNFWTFKSISLKRSGLPYFFSSNTFFGDRFSFVACLISVRYFDLNFRTVFSLRLLDLKCFIAAEFQFIEAYFPISQCSFGENFLYDFRLFFSSKEPSTSLTTVLYSTIPRSVSLWRGYILNKQWNLMFKESLREYAHFLRFLQNWV